MILLTGHQGFVGSSLMQRFPDEQWHTTRLDVNTDAFQELLAEGRTYTAVVHCVGQAIVSECERDPLTAFRNNTMSVISVLEGVRRHHPGIPVVVLETDKVYGRQVSERARETDPLLGFSPYEKSKVLAAEACDFYRDYYGMKIFSLRMANTYGPLDRNLSRIIPGTLDRLWKGQCPVIWTGSEDHEREYLYIDDLCDVIMEFTKPGRTPGAYNVTSGCNHRTIEVVEIIQKLMGTKLPIVYEGKTFSEIPYQELSGEKLMLELGWKPRTTLREGIKKILEEGLDFSLEF